MSDSNHVDVSKATLRGIKSSVGIIVLGMLFIVVALVIKLVNDHDRCLAGNDFRRNDLPAAFELSHKQIGEALGANEDQIVAFDDGFQAELAKLLPARDCGWLD